jgi:hypothetical protein
MRYVQARRSVLVVCGLSRQALQSISTIAVPTKIWVLGGKFRYRRTNEFRQQPQDGFVMPQVLGVSNSVNKVIGKPHVPSEFSYCSCPMAASHSAICPAFRVGMCS